VNRDLARRTRQDVVQLARDGLDWVSFAEQSTEAIRRVVPFSRTCWHTVDPGSVLFTGNLSQNITCSGPWLAQHEYVLDDVNKWWFLAQSRRLAGAMSLATHGDLSRSARHRSQESYGIGDELRGSFVVDDTYWGAVGFLRDVDAPWFTEEDVRLLASLCGPLAEGFRRAMLNAPIAPDEAPQYGPGVVIFDESGNAESLSPAAEHWIGELIEEPAPRDPSESKMIQLVAARARAGADGQSPMGLAARSRAQTRSGAWLLLYGTRLSGPGGERTAVIIQPATPHEGAPLVALAYGLSERECQVTRLCIQGHSTKQMAGALSLSPYTVQDHLKSIFAKTGVRSRGELVGQVFLEHYAPRWEDAGGTPSGWSMKAAADVPTRPG